MLDRVSRADRLAGGGALLAVIATLLPWYHFDEGATRVTVNAFGTGFLGDAVFLCAAGVLLLVLVDAGAVVVNRPPRSAGLTFGVAAAGLAAAVLQVLIGVNGSGAFHSATVGLGVALVGCAVMAAGGWLARSAGSRGAARLHGSR